MNVLWLIPSRPVAWISTLAKSLTETGKIRLTILSAGIGDYSKTVRDDITYIHLNAPGPTVDLLTVRLIRIYKIRHYLKKQATKYDLIHIHGTEHQFQAALKGISVPVVTSIQGILTEYLKVYKGRLKIRLSWMAGSFYEKKHLRHFKHFSCRTHWDKAFIRSRHPKAVIHHNWEMIRPDFFVDYTSNNSNTLFFAGGVNPIKGIKEALIAMDQVRIKMDINMIIAGSSDTEAISKLIQKYQLKNVSIADIQMLGHVGAEEFIKAYKRSFCLLHPSHIDNSPNTVCEAQVAGLPVIATDVGGVSSLIQNGETGLLVKLDSSDIAWAILQLKQSRELQKKLSENAKSVALERHNPQSIIAKTFQIYEEVLSDPF